MNTKQVVLRRAKILTFLPGIVAASIFVTDASASSRHKLSLDALNANIGWCFEATEDFELIKNASDLHKLTAPCDKIIRNTLSSRKTEANALYNRGVIHFYGGELDGAKGDMTRALQLTPELHQAKLVLGAIAVKQGDLRIALNHYQAVYEQEPGNLAVGKKLDWLNRKIAEKSDDLLSMQ